MFKRASLALLAVPLLAVALIACGDDDDDGPEPTEPTATETASATEQAGEQVEGTTFEISSEGLEFDTEEIRVPAGPLTVVYTNNENVPHNFAVYADEDFSEVIVRGETFQGPDESDTVEVDNLEPGTYYFRCDVHPDMKGVIVVE